MRHPVRKLLASLAFCTAVLACDSRRLSTTAPFSAELGVYALRSVNGDTPPIPLERGSVNTTRELIADTIVLSSGGNVREVFYARTITGTTDTALSSVALTGKYTITRDSIRLPPDFPYVFGRYSAGTLKMVDSRGDIWLFTR